MPNTSCPTAGEGLHRHELRALRPLLVLRDALEGVAKRGIVGPDDPLVHRRCRTQCEQSDPDSQPSAIVAASALVAQGIERGSPKAGVAGSNPAGGTYLLVRPLGPASIDRPCAPMSSSAERRPRSLVGFGEDRVLDVDLDIRQPRVLSLSSRWLSFVRLPGRCSGGPPVDGAGKAAPDMGLWFMLTGDDSPLTRTQSPSTSTPTRAVTSLSRPCCTGRVRTTSSSKCPI